MFINGIFNIKVVSSLVAVHGAAAVLPLCEAVVTQELPVPLLAGRPSGAEGETGLSCVNDIPC